MTFTVNEKDYLLDGKPFKYFEERRNTDIILKVLFRSFVKTMRYVKIFIQIGGNYDIK